MSEDNKTTEQPELPWPEEPCPFCGTPARCEDGEHELNVKTSSHKNIDLDVGVCSDVHYAYCIMCGAQGPASKTELEAIQEWNRRK
jgi:Lar family restriction alleviation protein